MTKKEIKEAISYLEDVILECKTEIEMSRRRKDNAERSLIAAAVPFKEGDWVIAVKDVPDIHCRDNSPLVEKGRRCKVTKIEMNGRNQNEVRCYDFCVVMYFDTHCSFPEKIWCVTPAFLSRYFKKIK
jgi:hypothetical protein